MPVKVRSRTRPIRVAYLVEDLGPQTGALMDAIYAECYSRWGGRFSLLVPSSGRGPVGNYEGWLAAFDPDVIYSYVDLDEDAAANIHEIFFPSYLVRHHIFKDDGTARTFQPRLPLPCLSSVTLLPELGVPAFGRSPGRPTIVDVFGRADSDIISRSFGFYSRSFSRSFGPPYNDLAQNLVLASADAIKDRNRYFPDSAVLAHSTAQILDQITSGRATTVSQLAARSASRLEVAHDATFYVTVGDDFVDRVLFWNIRLLNGEVLGLCLPANVMQDEETTAAIGRLIAAKSNVGGGGGGAARVAVVSASVSAEELEVVAKALDTKPMFQRFTVHGKQSVTSCVPSKRALDRATEIGQMGLAEAAALWHDTSSQSVGANVEPDPPPHLAYCPPWMLSRNGGNWSVDCDIAESSGEDAQAAPWELPRRLRFARLLLEGHKHEPRVSKGGRLTAYQELDHRSLKVKIPEFAEAIRYALILGRDYVPFQRDARGRPPQAFHQIRTSDSGRNFRGVLELFGGYDAADSVLRHTFWQRLFADMGGSPAAVERRRSQVQEELVRELADMPSPSGTALAEILAGLVVREAERVRSETVSKSWPSIWRQFSELQTKSWKEDDAGHLTPADKTEYKAYEAEHFKAQVQELCERGVLYQGYEIKCAHCHHRNWIGLASLDTKVRCEVCGTEAPAPVDEPWQFRLNEFLRSSLRKKGILPLVWAAHRLRPRMGLGFQFIGPIDVFVDADPEEGGKPLTDIDLTCLAGGKVVMCEVKQGSFNITEEQLGRFCEAVRRSRPDVAALAVMEPAGERLQTLFQYMVRQLEGLPVEPRLITLDRPEVDLRTHVMELGS